MISPLSDRPIVLMVIDDDLSRHCGRDGSEISFPDGDAVQDRRIVHVSLATDERKVCAWSDEIETAIRRGDSQ